MEECKRPEETGLRRRPPSFLTTVAVVSVCSCYDYSYTLPSLRHASPYVWFSARCGSSLLLCQMLPLSKWALTGRTTRFGTISWLSHPPCIGHCIGVAANENVQRLYSAQNLVGSIARGSPPTPPPVCAIGVSRRRETPIQKTPGSEQNGNLGRHIRCLSLRCCFSPSKLGIS